MPWPVRSGGRTCALSRIACKPWSKASSACPDYWKQLRPATRFLTGIKRIEGIHGCEIETPLTADVSSRRRRGPRSAIARSHAAAASRRGASERRERGGRARPGGLPVFSQRRDDGFVDPEGDR